MLFNMYKISCGQFCHTWNMVHSLYSVCSNNRYKLFRLKWKEWEPKHRISSWASLLLQVTRQKRSGQLLKWRWISKHPRQSSRPSISERLAEYHQRFRAGAAALDVLHSVLPIIPFFSWIIFVTSVLSILIGVSLHFMEIKLGGAFLRCQSCNQFSLLYKNIIFSDGFANLISSLQELHQINCIQWWIYTLQLG